MSNIGESLESFRDLNDNVNNISCVESRSVYVFVYPVSDPPTVCVSKYERQER